MPEYLAPGVYLEEVASGVTPMQGVSTSTAGFVGETARGPVRPTLVRSWTEFVARYGDVADAAPGGTTSTYLPHAVRGFFENGGSRLVIGRVTGRSAATATLSIGSLTLHAVGPGSWGNTVGVTVKPAAANPGLFVLEIACGDFAETFEDLSTDPTHPAFAKSVVNPASELIEITGCPDDPVRSEAQAPLDGGTDAVATLDDFVGEGAELATGLRALGGINGISIMAAPADVRLEGLAAAVIDVCESRRDRFAVTAEIDPSRQAAQIRPVRETSWGATYHPWLRVEASYLPAGTALVPPHGHICGIYARVDNSRGVHRPPANEQVRGIVGLSTAVTQAEQDTLNPRGINIIRDFRPQRGILVWGARTMASDPEWKYVNVRRLFIFIERSIDRGLQWVVFEPNAEATWREVRRLIEEFLTRLWRSGALPGRGQEEAFYVRCDRGTMTDADIQQGLLICEIGVAPSKPAEFMILRIGVRTALDDTP